MELFLIIFHLTCEIFLNMKEFNIEHLKNWYNIGYFLIAIIGFIIVFDLLIKIKIALKKLIKKIQKLLK